MQRYQIISFDQLNLIFSLDIFYFAFAVHESLVCNIYVTSGLFEIYEYY
jgi:hypothetical protein